MLALHIPKILIGISYILFTYFITKISANFPKFSGWKKTFTVNVLGSWGLYVLSIVILGNIAFTSIYTDIVLQNSSSVSFSVNLFT